MEQETVKEENEKTIQSELTLQFQKLRQGLTMSSAIKLAVLTGTGLLGRVALQAVPSVEPIVPLAIVTSFFLGYRYGMPAGMGSFYLSNFLVWGGQGPWTIFQVIGTGAAALTGGLFGKISKSKYSLLGAALVGTLLYEFIVDLSFAFFGFLSPFLLFIAPLPFTLIHIASSLGFCSLLYAFKDKISDIVHDVCEIRIHSLRRVVSRSGDIRGKQLERVHHVLTFRRWRPRNSDD